MLRQLLLFILLFCFVYPKAAAQDTKAEYGVYNTALGSVVGGVGALINKKKDKKWGRVLLKGMWQGALGGILVHESKVLVGMTGSENSFQYSWYGKLANAAGNSIIENAALNRNFYEQVNVNFGFNRVEFHLKDKFKVRYKVMPVSFFTTMFLAMQTKFEWGKTLQSGELIFSASNSKFSRIEYEGTTFANVVLMNSRYLDNKYTYAHEFIHVYQYYDFNFVNAFINKPVYKLTNRWFGKANQFIYYDLQEPVFDAFYALEYQNNLHRYYDNFFEREAAVYSNSLP